MKPFISLACTALGSGSKNLISFCSTNIFQVLLRVWYVYVNNDFCAWQRGVISQLADTEQLYIFVYIIIYIFNI